MSLRGVTSPPASCSGAMYAGVPARSVSPAAPARPKSVSRTLPVAVEHDVRRLQIAMDDVAFVRGGEAGANLPRNLERAVFGETADAAEQRCEILAVDVFHRQEGAAVDLVDVVDAADVGVRHLARHAHFGVQLRQLRRIAVDVGGQELERDRLTELEIVGAINLAHPAAPAALDDAIAAAEQRARREATVVDGSGRGEPAARHAAGWRASAGTPRVSASGAQLRLPSRRREVSRRRGSGVWH